MPQITEYQVAQHNAKRNYVPRFSLAETLASVIVLGLIAAILFPVFARRDGCGGSTRSSCQSNLRQIGLGIIQYAQDYDEEFPRQAILTIADSIKPKRITSWRQALYPYTKNYQLFHCPQNSARENVTVIDGYPQSYDVTDTGPIRLNNTVRVNDVPSPGTTIMVFEEHDDTPQARQIGVPWDSDSGADGWTNILYAGHSGGSSYLFCDGHVKWYKPMDTILNDVNMWHLDNRDPISPRAMQKLQAAEKNFPLSEVRYQSAWKKINQKYFFLTGRK